MGGHAAVDRQQLSGDVRTRPSQEHHRVGDVVGLAQMGGEDGAAQSIQDLLGEVGRTASVMISPERWR